MRPSSFPEMADYITQVLETNLSQELRTEWADASGNRIRWSSDRFSALLVLEHGRTFLYRDNLGLVEMTPLRIEEVAQTVLCYLWDGTT